MACGGGGKEGWRGARVNGAGAPVGFASPGRAGKEKEGEGGRRRREKERKKKENEKREKRKKKGEKEKGKGEKKWRKRREIGKRFLGNLGNC
jgi:hypothetical protein